ncbi:metal-sensitive transcriptional regulator [Coriobacteriia bacterium Es71-Z0120]|uniref:metal-sensitive transcriptional regulator n=1 Tax=Parvivirga hydrogeniphila TaxID=2939460 RepID=UPI002260C55E|nr:metal-sensitive transcriptional regulator [Parvivirga hydrogeniphila]MCL4078896.1 metal-sensitive transcriptional regulator [Parvivirga hydrogeniphila]
MVEQTRAIALDVRDEERRRILNRLRRLEGQIRGLQSMISSDKDCEAILTQIMAAKSALNQVGLHIIAHSMKTCLVDDAEKTREELIDEALGVFLKYSSCLK